MTQRDELDKIIRDMLDDGTFQGELGPEMETAQEQALNKLIALFQAERNRVLAEYTDRLKVGIRAYYQQFPDANKQDVIGYIVGLTAALTKQKGE